jgi:hypothetical protein
MKTRTRERGSQLVEFALVLPLLLLLAFLVTEGAGMIRVHQVLNNAAREGARLATLEHSKPPASCSSDPACTCDATCVHDGLVAAVVAYGVRNGLPACGGSTTPCFGTANVTVQQNCQLPVSGTDPVSCDPAVGCSSPPCMGASRVTATYSYQFTFLPRLPGFSFANSITLSAEAVFRNLYS